MSAPTQAGQGGAQDHAATQQAAPRVIDENTDMSTLTDQEIMRLMEGMDHNEDVMSKVNSSLSIHKRSTMVLLARWTSEADAVVL